MDLALILLAYAVAVIGIVADRRAPPERRRVLGLTSAGLCLLAVATLVVVFTASNLHRRSEGLSERLRTFYELLSRGDAREKEQHVLLTVLGGQIDSMDKEAIKERVAGIGKGNAALSLAPLTTGCAGSPAGVCDFVYETVEGPLYSWWVPLEALAGGVTYEIHRWEAESGLEKDLRQYTIVIDGGASEVGEVTNHRLEGEPRYQAKVLHFPGNEVACVFFVDPYGDNEKFASEANEGSQSGYKIRAGAGEFLKGSPATRDPGSHSDTAP